MSVAPIREAVGTDIVGARGASLADQNKIDATLAGPCKIGALTRQECARHDQVSAEHRRTIQQIEGVTREFLGF